MTNKNLLKILFVEDVLSDAELEVLVLRKAGLQFEFERVDLREHFIKALNNFKPDIVISDYSMPEYDGSRALMDTRKFDPLLPFILCTGSINEETAVECLKAGANDYVIKEHMTRLPFAVKESLEQHRIQLEKRVAELLLRENEEKLQSIFSAAPVGIGLVVNRILIEVNDTFCDMTGFSRKELIGKSSEQIYATKKEYENDGAEKYKQISDKGMGSVVTRFKCKNGKILNILLSSAPLDRDDQTKGVTFTALDITQRQLTEEALHKSQHLFQTLAQVSPVGIFRTDPDGYTTYVNPKWSELSGLAPEAADGLKWLNAVHPDDLERLKKSWLADFKSKRKSTSEYRFLRSDGNIVWVMGNAVPELIGNEIVGYIGTITDITERKRSEEILKESEIKYRRIFENVQDMFYEASIEGIMLEVSPSVELISKGQYKRDLVIGKSMFDFIYNPLDGEALMSVLLERGFVSDLEIILKNLDGSPIHCSVSSKIIMNAQGRPEKIIGSMRDITDRKYAENALIESEIKYRQLVTQSPDGIFIVDLTGKFVSVNTSICETLKYSEKELLSTKLLNIVPEKYHALHKERFSAIMSGGNLTSNAEYEVTGKDGINHSVEVLSVPYYKGNEIVGFQGIARDITERKRAEKLLQESEEKYRRIFENVQDLYYESSIDGTILEMSPSIEALSMGLYHREDLIGKSMYEFYSDKENRFALLSVLKEKGLVSDFEITLKNRDGSFIPCSISAKISNNPQGRPEKIIGSMRNITQRKAAEEAIIRERRMLRTLIDNLPDPIYFLDKDCRKVIANRADVSNIGAANEAEVLGKTDLELFHGDTGLRGHAYNENVIKSGNAIFDYEEDFVNNEGKKRWLLSTKIPLRDKEEKVTGLVGIGHDITERKFVEEELIRAKEKAEESDRLKTAFIHNISHEIRTPMNAIVGFSALLGEPDNDIATQNSYLETIQQSSNHLLSIITDIIDISNIEAHIIKISRDEIDINRSLKTVCNQFLLKMQEKQIKHSCESSLSDKETKIIADATKINQILANLISNAIKFTAEGNIRVTCRRTGSFLEISVSDTGIGISAEHHLKVFDRFYQVDNKTSKLYEGTGLGLAISKAYVELMGGKIWLNSEPGSGTTFFFTIPYERQKSVQLPVIENPAPKAFAFATRKKILVAEDIESNFKLITFFLSGSNTELIYVVNGKEAVEKCLDEGNFDLILMDIKMPVMDGYEAVKLIREKNKTIPIIAQTAYADDKDKAFSCGCSGFISKPFDKKTLLKAISELI
jgi:PAS domain S-box-containing protein